MPAKKKPDSIPRPATSTAPHPDVVALKAVMSTLPTFSSPARVWAQKVRLLYPLTSSAPPQIVEAIKAQLPTKLFDATADLHYESHLPLLEKIVALEGPTADQAAQCILEGRGQLREDQTPKEFFREMKRLTQVAFTEISAEQVDQIAWKKLQAVLPTTIRHSLCLLTPTIINEDLLDSLDRSWQLHLSSIRTTAAVTTSEKALDKIATTLEAITARLDQLEANHNNEGTSAALRRPNARDSASICYYHRKFGKAAFRCAPPCNFAKLNGTGAPSPR